MSLVLYLILAPLGLASILFISFLFGGAISNFLWPNSPLANPERWYHIVADIVVGAILIAIAGGILNLFQPVGASVLDQIHSALSAKR